VTNSRTIKKNCGNTCQLPRRDERQAATTVGFAYTPQSSRIVLTKATPHPGKFNAAERWHVCLVVSSNRHLWYLVTTLPNSKHALAYHTELPGGPMTGLNDIAHTYACYLLPQPDVFTLPSWDAGRGYNPVSVYARMNFSVDAMFVEVGAPIAANYFRAQNPNNTATALSKHAGVDTYARPGRLWYINRQTMTHQVV